MQYEKGSKVRNADYPIDPIFLDRWSPRAMSGELMTEEELIILFEAARWAPSSSNEQPWRFIYAFRETPFWNDFLNFLDDGNKEWCKNASVLVVLIAKKHFSKGGENRNCMSDSGAAWENLALEGVSKGYVVHGMAGFDIKKVREKIGVGSDYEIVHMIAIGKPGDKESLSEKNQKREKPSLRNPVSEFAFEGGLREEL